MNRNLRLRRRPHLLESTRKFFATEPADSRESLRQLESTSERQARLCLAPPDHQVGGGGSPRTISSIRRLVPAVVPSGSASTGKNAASRISRFGLGGPFHSNARTTYTATWSRGEACGLRRTPCRTGGPVSATFPSSSSSRASASSIVSPGSTPPPGRCQPRAYPCRTSSTCPRRSSTAARTPSVSPRRTRQYRCASRRSIDAPESPRDTTRAAHDCDGSRIPPQSALCMNARFSPATTSQP
jgi:hypothetical protein